MSRDGRIRPNAPSRERPGQSVGGLLGGRVRLPSRGETTKPTGGRRTTAGGIRKKIEGR